MFRYLRLYLYFIRFSFTRAMEFRIDFWFRILMDVVYYAMNIAFYKILFLQSASIGGWNESQAMVFVGAFCVVDALQMTLISNNMWEFIGLVNKGDLDYYLVRPVSTLFFVSLRDFAASSFLNLLIAFGILGWALTAYPEPYSWLQLVVFLLLILNGTFLYYLIRLFFVLTVFWTHSPRGMDRVFFSLTHFLENPDGIFTGWARRVFTTFLPFCLMASFPSRILFEGLQFELIGQIIVVTLVLYFIALFVWSQALKVYSSASS